MEDSVAVIGNGAIGISACISFIEKGFKKIFLIGPQSADAPTNLLSASRAAGAMLNIGSEIDHFFDKSPQSIFKLTNASKALESWQNQSQLIDDPGLIGENKTCVYLDSKTKNQLEKLSFIR